MFLWRHKGKDVSNLIEAATLSGETTQAARTLEFTLACNPQDDYLPSIDIECGQTIYMYHKDDTTEQEKEVFRGIVFYRERDTSSMVMRFTAYDYLIYLNKSKTTKKFKGILAENAVRQVCNELGVVPGDIASTGVYVDFIADSKSGMEIIKEAMGYAAATLGKKYIPIMREGVMDVIEKGRLVEGYTADDNINIEKTTYSESIEDVVNQVLIVDKDGNHQGYVKNDEDIKKYSLLQDVYKVDDKQNTQTQAKALLKSKKNECSLSGIGEILCKTGYAIIVQNEQLKGKFYIKSDRHNITNGVHTMELQIEFMELAGGDTANGADGKSDGK